MRKVIVIGLDAACFDIMMPWLDEGELPNLKRLMDAGVYSDLKSIIPPVTPPAWLSITTGKNPAKHGIFHFFKRKEANPYELELVSSRDNKAKYIWEYLADLNLSSIVVNVPLTHPARKTKGVLIPGFPSPRTPSCYPPEILQDFERTQGRYWVTSDDELKRNVPPKKRIEAYIELESMRKRTALYFAQKYPWDFLMVEFQKTDDVGHEYGDTKYALDLYQHVDKCIGEIVDTIGENANILLVSDHGQKRDKWYFHINSWLEGEGFLKTTVGGESSNRFPWAELMELDQGKSLDKVTTIDRVLGFLGRKGVTIETMMPVVRKLHLNFLRRFAPPQVTARIRRKQIDWAQTEAYSEPTSCGIRVNLREREPLGTVQPGEQYQALRTHLVQKLRELKDPDGETVFERVLLCEEYYHGPEINHAPDIVLLPREMDYGITDAFSPKAFSPATGYDHDMEGFFVAVGPDIKDTGPLDSVPTIMDIAPTVLHVMGSPIPKDMDGRVLKEIFKEGSKPAQRDVLFKEALDEAARVRKKIRRLKSLGNL